MSTDRYNVLTVKKGLIYFKSIMFQLNNSRRDAWERNCKIHCKNAYTQAIAHLYKSNNDLYGNGRKTSFHMFSINQRLLKNKSILFELMNSRRHTMLRNMFMTFSKEKCSQKCSTLLFNRQTPFHIFSINQRLLKIRVFCLN